MTNKIKIQKNQSIITEADKIITRLKIKHGIKKPLYLKQIPAIYYGILIKGGFKIYPHQFSKYGKVSISLRKTIDKQNIHILLRSTESGKNWIKIHADEGFKDHKSRKLNALTAEKLSDIIQNGILYAINNPEWLEQQQKLYQEHQTNKINDPNKNKMAKKIKNIADFESKGWLTTHEKELVEKRRERINKKLK